MSGSGRNDSMKADSKCWSEIQGVNPGHCYVKSICKAAAVHHEGILGLTYCGMHT